MLHVLSWWLLIQLLGLAALPLAYRLFRWLPSRGYAFAKPLGLLVSSYVLWLGSSLGYLRNTLGGALAAIAVTAGVSLVTYVSREEETEPSLLTFLREHLRLILTVEILFTVGFVAWAGLRAYAPEKIMSSGGEKFMEIAFLNAILQSPTFPPRDPWLSGFAISYYYFGYVMMALLTRLSGVLAGVGFELYDALMFALTLTGAFGVVHGLVTGARGNRPDDRQALQYGLLGSLFVAVIGNLEGLLEAWYARGLLPDSFWRWIDIPDLAEVGRVTGSWYPGHGWWWWRASRVIRDRNLIGEAMPLNPIDEFPFFSFLLGDNHPHVLALPFVLLAVALAFNLLRREQRGEARPGSEEGESEEERPLAKPGGIKLLRAGLMKYVLDGDWALFALYALGLGSLGFLNTWDFPIYVGLTVLAYAVGRHAQAGESLIEAMQRAAVLGVGLTVAGVLLYLPFYIGFSSQAGGIAPYLLAPTRLPQYLVMFGPFVFVAASFLLAQLFSTKHRAHALASLARWWGAIIAVPLLLLGSATAIVALTEPGSQLIESILADPRVQQAVGSAGPGAALKAVVMARLRDPWLFLTLSLLMAGAVVGILKPGRPEDDRQPVVGERSSGCAVILRPTSNQFASLLILIGLGLTFVVEFVYLRDSFGVRMNTIFKFYYQAWVMLGCASAFGVWWIVKRVDGQKRPVLRTVFVVGTVLLTAGGLVYPMMASYSRVDGFQHKPNLDGTINIAQAHPDDWAAIEWLRDNVQEVPVVLEAPGKSYNYEGRISAFTGYPAVLGWALHESQWRGNYDEQGKREPDIETIYTTSDGQQALTLLHQWAVDYVILGPPERRYVENLCSGSDRPCNSTEALGKFRELLVPVFERGRTTIYRVPNG